MIRIQEFLWQGLLALAIGLLASPAWADDPSDKGWTKHENLKPVIGADGKLHQATCSGYPGTNAKFSFWSKRGKSKNLAVFFEGGGACWDNVSCTFPIAEGLPPGFPQFFVPEIPASTNPAEFDGIFRSDNDANPVKDWTMVYIPYCTGDLHSGSTTKQYFNAGNPFLPVAPPQSFSIEHRGFDNFMVVLDWMKKNIDDPEKVLVAGSSAGGYGATSNFPWIDRTFKEAQTYLIADASQGVTTDNFDVDGPGRQSWDLQLPPWVFGKGEWQGDSSDLMRLVANKHPRSRVAQFTTALDSVQIDFYGYMKLAYPPGGACPNPAIDWNQQMVGTLQSNAAQVPNFRYYLADGSFHTLLRSPLFYTEDSAGSTYSSWVQGMLKNRGRTGAADGHWENAACEGCLLSLPCQ